MLSIRSKSNSSSWRFFPYFNVIFLSLSRASFRTSVKSLVTLAVRPVACSPVPSSSEGLVSVAAETQNVDW